MKENLSEKATKIIDELVAKAKMLRDRNAIFVNNQQIKVKDEQLEKVSRA